jgi:hypothetical protein
LVTLKELWQVEIYVYCKLKVRALPKDLPDFVEADITPLDMGNKLYVTKVPTPNLKSCTQTTLLSVK